jgi:hypothetical protein
MRARFVIGFVGVFVLAAFISVDDFSKIVIQKLVKFKQESPQVKVYLFFNQSVYMPGDTAYLSARFLTEDLAPVPGRQVVRLELQDASGKLLFFENIGVKDGVGVNQTAIPEGLKAGVYQWVAYNEWMRNFSPELYFRQNFIVIEKSELKRKSIPEDFRLNFFPEGGQLISSVNNHVVITSNKLIDSVTVVDDGGTKVAQCLVDKNGLGELNIIPDAERAYYAKANFGGNEVRVALPNSSEEGIAVRLSRDNAEGKLELHTPQGSKVRSENLWMVISAHSRVYFTAPLYFENSKSLLMRFPINDLPEGICYATIFNDQGKVLAERVFLGNPNSKVQTTISLDKAQYDTRSMVDMRVSLKDESGNPLQGNLAISVVNKKFLTKLISPSSIKQYLNIDSEMGRKQIPGNLDDSEIDVFLVTQKNIRINWQQVWSEVYMHNHYFGNRVQYSGRILDRQTGTPVQDSSRVLVYLQKALMGYEATIEQGGNFELLFLFDFWNDDEMFYMVEDKAGRTLDVIAKWHIDSTNLSSSTILLEEDGLESNYATFQTRSKLINQSFGFYGQSSGISKSNSKDDPNFEFEDELSGADFTINIGDYVVFPSMGELIREIIPNLQYRKIKGREIVRVMLPDVGFAADDPLYIIDGIMTRNTKYFLTLKPGDIISIKVVKGPKKLIQMGSIAKNGIVLVHTKGLKHENLLRDNTTLPVKGLNKPVPFHLTNQSTSPRIPDFGTTLYWNPLVSIDARGEAQIRFPISDDVGTFLIQIQGLTSDGHPFERIDSLSVVFNKH